MPKAGWSCRPGIASGCKSVAAASWWSRSTRINACSSTHLPDWEEIERKLMRLPTLNPRARRLQRLMVGHATDLELDGHGRVLLPPNLREFGSLTRDAMLIGQGAALRVVG